MKLKKPTLSRFLLLSILVIALVVRLWDLGNMPPGLNQDEAVGGYDAYCISTNLRDHHGSFLPIIFESFGDWVSPVLTYITVPFVKVLGLSAFSIRLPVALLGIATVYLCYLIAKEIFKKETPALIAAFLLAISPWHILNSRWAVPPSIVPFFLSLGILFFIRAHKKYKSEAYKKFIIQMIFSMIAFGITAHVYPTMKVFVPLLVGVLTLIFYFRSWKSFKKNLKYLLIPLALFGLIIAPIFVLTLLEGEKYNFRFEQVSIFGKEQSPTLLFISNYLSYLSPDFLFRAGDSDAMHSVRGWGVMHIFEALAFYFGIATLILSALKVKILQLGENFRYIAIMLLVWLIIFPVSGSLTISSPHTLRTIQALPLLQIITAFGFWVFYQALRKSKFSKEKLLNVCVLVVFLFLSFEGSISFVLEYFGDYSKSVRTDFQYGIEETFEYINENKGNAKSIVIDESITSSYIYALFFTHYDPNSLDYDDFQADNPGEWIKVEEFDIYKFQEVNEEDMSGKELEFYIDRYCRACKDFYKVYRDGDTLIVNRVDNE
jgi:4-amino-4-deoxy-L-arabinose transferase-like glycosyltransferase